MIRYLIKNNFKIMFRNGVNILLFVFCPIVVSAVLMSAFSSLMESYEAVPEFEVGYRFEDDGKYEDYIKYLEKAGEENGITFVQYDNGSPKKLIDEHELGGFVEFKDDTYKVYESDDAKVEGTALEYMMSAFFNAAISGDVNDISINVKKPSFAPAISSTDYYGMIYIAYFGWCAIVCAAGLFSNEKKNKIDDRLKVSNLSVAQLYIARLVPIVSVVSIGIGVASVVIALAFGVHWGNIALSAAIVFVSIVAATSFEMFLYELTGSMVATIIISFSVVWFAGFFGGSFETYMYATHPETLKLAMPLYHENRALVELSSTGSSPFVKSSLLYSGAIAVVTSALTILVGSVRRLGK
ncbi:MAG: ABC transporter permease [Lachnospiraceae bacterium]|nr:ABC transporter permease [Lachnospiraceae bacterium]